MIVAQLLAFTVVTRMFAAKYRVLNPKESAKN
jgi:hypothetical protein